jgi:hypothetical protein
MVQYCHPVTTAPPPQTTHSDDVFTFLHVDYHGGSFSSLVFDTLREGLRHTFQDSFDYKDDIKYLEALPDEELLTELLWRGE